MSKHKDRIRNYLKKVSVEFNTMKAAQDAFLRCDHERTGQVKKIDFLESLSENNIRLPKSLLTNVLEDMQLNRNDTSDDAVLIYKNLCDIISIFQNCPTTLPHERNFSENFVKS
jgi:Ca2+-binding EF-hand superfamily protein